MFKRGQDPKITIGIGIKEGNYYNISDLTDENIILPGIISDDIYTIIHMGSGKTVGFCSGKKAMKVILGFIKEGNKIGPLMKKELEEYHYKWLWDPRLFKLENEEIIYPRGGYLYYNYSSDGKFWVNANNTMGYSFYKPDNLIMEL